MRHIVHQSCSAFYESGCLGMQPKMGVKLLLKLNIGMRPIAIKYRERNMKREERKFERKLTVLEKKVNSTGNC